MDHALDHTHFGMNSDELLFVAVHFKVVKKE